jgi:25S rRNA (adenine(2142)-N(1))-methyltransferase, Bmt2
MLYIRLQVVNCLTDPEKRGEMLCRLVAQLKPQKSVLFLALPIRCIKAKHVGEERFDQLLAGLGLVPLIEKRVTPRVVFYVLGRSPNNSSVSGDNHEAVPAKKKKCVKTATDDGGHNDLTKAGGAYSWKDTIQDAICHHSMDRTVWDHFNRDCSAVPPTEFSLTLRGLHLSYGRR